MPNRQRATPNLPPHRGFDDPTEIAAAPLSYADKMKLLREWEQDLRALLVATDENMTPAEPGNSGELLRSVRRTIESLDRSRGARDIEDPTATRGS